MKSFGDWFKDCDGIAQEEEEIKAEAVPDTPIQKTVKAYRLDNYGNQVIDEDTTLRDALSNMDDDYDNYEMPLEMAEKMLGPLDNCGGSGDDDTLAELRRQTLGDGYELTYYKDDEDWKGVF